MESHSAFTASIASGTTNPYRLIRERLESYLPSNHRRSLGIQPRSDQQQVSGSHPAATGSSSFINVSNILDVIPSSTKSLAMDNSLWRRHRCCASIKDSTFAARNLCKYTWEVMICMVLIGKGRLGPDIWTETPQQAKNTKSMLIAAWNTEAMWWQNASRTLNSPLSLTGKEVKHVRALLICNWCQQNKWYRHRFWTQSWALELILWKKSKC